MYTIDQLDTYMKEQCKDSKDMQAAWNCLSTPVKKSDPLYPNRFTHWNCGAVNASLMMALSYINLLGQPIFRTDAIALAAKAAGVDMKEAEKKAAPFAEKHLFTLVKNPTLTPAALLLFHLCQQTYRNCKGENLAKAIEALAKYGVTTSLEIENLDKTVQNIMQTFGMVFLKMESDMIRGEQLTSNTAEIAAAKDEFIDSANAIETAVNKKLQNSIKICRQKFDKFGPELIATIFLVAISKGSSIHKSTIGNIIISQTVVFQAPFIPLHSSQGDSLPSIEIYPALPFIDGFSPLQQYAANNTVDQSPTPQGEVLSFLTEYRMGSRLLPKSRRVDNFISATTGRPFYGDGFCINEMYMKPLLAHGLTQQEARDAALIISVITRLNSVQYGSENHFENSYTLTPNPEQPAPAKQPQKDCVPLEKYTSLERRVKAMDSEIQSLNHQINELQKLLEERELRIENNEELIDTYEKVLQEYDRGENDVLAKTETCAEEVSFPAAINKNVVVYGGFDNFRSTLAELLPDVNIIPHTNLSADMTPFRNADIIFIQVNYLSHSKFYNIRDFAKANNIPLRTLRTAGAKSCAKYIIEETASL